jgi:ribonucleoside-diphosphate reductase beta chain
MDLEIVKLFNKDGDDAPENQKIINGNPTGISNLNENKFKWTSELYRTMLSNFWIPEKVTMTDDKVTINELTESELKATKDTLSFLIFLDSFQCLNLPNIQKYITAPNVNNIIIIQQYQEVIHSQSYQYVLEALFPLMTREEIYNRWRDSPELLDRINYVTKISQSFLDEPNEEQFKKVVIINLLLESIYFYQGFMFFDQLTSRNKLKGTGKIIDYIRRDEITHIGIFVNIIKELFSKDDEQLIYTMFEQAVQQEIDWSHHVYGDSILGISRQSSAEYVKFLANDRLSRIGLNPLYPNVVKNPYAHLEQANKENFFETTVTSYDRSESVSGWGDF